MILVSPNKSENEFIAALYSEMYRPLSAYAYGVLHNTALTEEAVQDTFRIACTKPENLIHSENPKGWLVNTLKNVLRNMKKSHARMRTYVLATVPLDEAIEVPAQENPYYEVLYSDLVQPDDYRLLKLLAVDKHSIQEVSEMYGISMDACRKRMQRAKNKMKISLEKNKNSMSQK